MEDTNENNLDGTLNEINPEIESAMESFLDKLRTNLPDPNKVEPTTTEPVITTEEVDEEPTEENDEPGEVVNPTNTPDDEEPPYQIFADILKDKLFNDEDLKDFDGSEEGFFKLMEATSERKAEEVLDSMIDSMPPKLRKQVQGFLDGMNEDQAISFGDKISHYEALTDDVLEVDSQKAEDVYREFLKSRNFNEAKINKMVKMAIEMDELADEAKEARESLKQELTEKAEKEKAETAAKREAEQKRAAESIENLKKDIMSRTELIPGVQLTDTMKKKVIDNLLNPVAKDSNGNSINKIQELYNLDATETAIMLSTYIELGLFNYDKTAKRFKPDLSKLVNYKKSQVIDDVQSKVKAAANRFKGGKNVYSNDSINTTTKQTVDAIKQAFAAQD